MTETRAPRSRARRRDAPARSRHGEPEGRRRQDHHRHQSRNRARGHWRARADPGSRSPGQRLDRARHQSQALETTSSYDMLVGEKSLRDVVIPTSVPRLFIAPSTMDLLGVELEIAGHADRSYKFRDALRAYGASSAGRSGTGHLCARRLPAVAQPSHHQRARRRRRGRRAHCNANSSRSRVCRNS